jgi:hypothetical protein
MNHVDIRGLLVDDVVLERPKDMKEAIKKAVAGFPVLKVNPDDLSFSFSPDHTIDKTVIPILVGPVVIVLELITDPAFLNEQGGRLRSALAMSLARKFRMVLLRIRGGQEEDLPMIKVGVKAFNPRDGYHFG